MEIHCGKSDYQYFTAAWRGNEVVVNMINFLMASGFFSFGLTLGIHTVRMRKS